MFINRQVSFICATTNALIIAILMGGFLPLSQVTNLVPPLLEPLVKEAIKLMPETKVVSASPSVAPVTQVTTLGTFTVNQANCTNNQGTTNTVRFQDNGSSPLDCVIPVSVDTIVTDYDLSYRFDPVGQSFASEANRVDVVAPSGTVDTHTNLGGSNNRQPYTYNATQDNSFNGENSGWFRIRFTLLIHRQKSI